MMPVRDWYGRGFTGLRISVTQRCNLACAHCHREGQPRSTDEMTPQEIGRIARTAAALGATKVKITGGEPLVRDDLHEIVSAIRPSMKEISMTTNGILLERWAPALKRAGLDRANMSIHSLSRERLASITGKDYLDSFVRGLTAACDAGLGPIKLNMVVLRGINEDEIRDMIGFASQHGAILQLIELACDRSRCNEDFFLRHYYPLAELESEIAREAVSKRYNELHRRARYSVELDGGLAQVEFVRSMHNSLFCANCTRLRVSSDGKLKGCLYENGNSPELLKAVRRGARDDELTAMFFSSLNRRKPYWS